MVAATGRNGIFRGLIALGLLAVMATTSSPARADSGVAPFMPEPAWDRKMGTATRFLILTNWSSQAVLDKETGLVWERTPDGNTRTWSAARDFCSALKTGDRYGWRLPSVHELMTLLKPSIVDLGGVEPGLPTNHPFVFIIPAYYWTATTVADATTTVWTVHMRFGTTNTPLKSSASYTWCVRGSMNADQY